jgi:hypothetical protein
MASDFDQIILTLQHDLKRRSKQKASVAFEDHLVRLQRLQGKKYATESGVATKEIVKQLLFKNSIAGRCTASSSTKVQAKSQKWRHALLLACIVVVAAIEITLFGSPVFASAGMLCGLDRRQASTGRPPGCQDGRWNGDGPLPETRERREPTPRSPTPLCGQASIISLCANEVYCGPVLRHPAECMLPAVDLGGRVWLGSKPCKGGLRPPPSAADGLSRTR